jgi:PAS domain S-box-containing protein
MHPCVYQCKAMTNLFLAMAKSYDRLIVLSRCCSGVLFVLALWSAAANAAGANVSSNVMLLVSYNAGMTWSDEQISGVKHQLQLFYPAVNLRLDFLDTKQIQPSPQYYQRMEELLRIKYGSTPPKMILTTDDDALDFALLLRQHLYPAVPILFSGVAVSRKSALARESNISGVFDDADVIQSLELILRVLPGTRRVMVVHDQSRTSLAQADVLRLTETKLSKIKMEFLNKLSVEAIQARLRSLGQGDIVLALAFNHDINGRVLTHEAASDLWAAASPVPVVVTRDVSMRPGVLGGYLITGRQQGTILGQMALQLLNKESVTSIPMRDGVGVPSFDYAQLRRWNISENKLPFNTVVLNRTDSSWVSLKPHMPWLGTLFGGMLIIIGLLINGIRLQRISEAALSNSAQNYRELFNSSNDAIIVRNATTGEISDTNKRFQSLYGYSASEALKLSGADISLNETPYTNLELQLRLKKVIHEGPQCFEWRSRRQDGSLFWSEVSMTSFDLPEGLRIVSTVRDISDRKLVENQTREFEHQMQQIYCNLPVAIFAIDAKHQVTFWNPQMFLLTGIAATEMIGTSDSWRGFYSSKRPVLADMVLDGQVGHQLEYLYEDKLRPSATLPSATEGEDFFPTFNNGKGMWLRFCAAPLSDVNGLAIGAIETIIDVTEHKLSQINLAELNQQLEFKVEARTLELKKAMSQLAQAEKMVALGSLVAGVAHELNTPIGNMLTAASTLRDMGQELNQKFSSGAIRRSEMIANIRTVQEASELIERNAARAAKLVTDFKEVAVGQSGRSLQLFNLRQIVQSVTARMKPILDATTHQLKIDIPADIEMLSHIEPLEQILGHFITNSLQHAFKGAQTGTIHISAHREGEDVILAYGDNGCGVPKNHLLRLFDPYFSTKFGQGGSGLGLYIVYNLVVGVFGGSIKVESTSTTGTTFSLRLPLNGVNAELN